MSGGNKKFIFKMHNNETPHGAGGRSQGRDRSRRQKQRHEAGAEAGERSEQKASGTQSLDKVSRAGEQGEHTEGAGIREHRIRQLARPGLSGNGNGNKATAPMRSTHELQRVGW